MIIQPNLVIEGKAREGVLFFLPVAIAIIVLALVAWHLSLAWCRGKGVEGETTSAGVDDG